MTYKDKHILVVGLGRSGRAALSYLVQEGASVVATDLNTQLDDLKAAFPTVKFVLGAHPPSCLDGVQMVVVSPGVPEMDLTREAKRRGISVVGEMELAVKKISAPIVAVTGTNGKSTTTALTGHLLKTGGKKVCVGGNIGTPILDLLPQAVASDVVVLEVSSYQLETTPSLHPKVGILLNITPDHLDRYGKMEKYVEAKSLIVAHMTPADTCVYNAEDERVVEIVEKACCQKIPFSVHAPNLPPVSTQLTGEHNLENMLAATSAVRILGVSDAAIAEGLKSFEGLPHRLQLVGEIMGVRYYDDSKGTNVGAVVKSLAGFSEPVHLIAGGQAKGSSFQDLRSSVRLHVKNLILMGEAKDQLQKELGDLVPTYGVGSMQEAVTLAQRLATPGDVVLLSPACASFDMFLNYADRGEKFTQAVRALQ